MEVSKIIRNSIEYKKCVFNGNEWEASQAIPEGFVDFGLPSGTLWYNKNIGATNGNTVESWYGDYYAWGELHTKTYYDWTDLNDATQNYKYANGDYNKLTKYCNNSEYGNEGFTDELTQLVPTDDVAVSSGWKMPTKEDFEELIAGTSSTWEEDYQGIEGLNGRVFIKATITRPAFKNITLYSPIVEGEVTDKMWAEISILTLEEINAVVGGDISTMIFKDAEMSILAEYDTDYGFAVKQIDSSVSMFIPAAGFYNGSALYNAGSYGYYWSSSLYLGNPSDAWYLKFNSDNNYRYDNYRYYGLSIRPVC